MHRLQRSAIKANCYAVGDGFKENVGYIVLDIRSAPEGNGVSLFLTNKLYFS